MTYGKFVAHLLVQLLEQLPWVRFEIAIKDTVELVPTNSRRSADS
jgi:hypothetical protein